MAPPEALRYNYPMKKKIILLMIFSGLSVLFLSGCTAGYWTWQHPDKLSDGQREQDLKECRELARQEVVPYYSYGFYLSFPSHPRHRHLSDPYYPYDPWYYHDSLLRYKTELDQYTRLCMKARGWQWVHTVPGQPESKP